MQTPVRRMTRNQMSGLGPSSGVKPPGRPASSTKKKELPRLPFTDLTNDSPISGLMPAKMAANSACVYESTPRSKLRPADRPIGEDLLRMQVTSLLRKVESEALMQNKSSPCVPDLFESPLRRAAPTPANTPATSGVPVPSSASVGDQEMKPAILPAIKISSPVCNLEVSLRLERTSPAFVATAELLSSIEETSPALNADGSVGTDQDEPPTTRTLKFDSPDKGVPGKESIHLVTAEVASRVETSTPASVSTAEILSSIEETCNTTVDVELTMAVMDGYVQEQIQPTTRTLKFDSPARQIPELERMPTIEGKQTIACFDSPQKGVPDIDIESGLFLSSAHPHGSAHAETDDDDAWSVIVNVGQSPEKIDGSLVENIVSLSKGEEAEAMEFVQSVLVDVGEEHRIEIPALWEHRDTLARKSKLKDDNDDYEDCKEYDDGGEDYDEEEAYEDGPEVFDEACEELCKGISHISMGIDGGAGLPAFQGKHIRFNYNSDDEMEANVVTDRTVDSPGKMRLHGLPTPKGKHLRFNDEADSDEDKC